MTIDDPNAGNPSPGEGEAATNTEGQEGAAATDAAKLEGAGADDGKGAGDAGGKGDEGGKPEGAPEAYEAFNLPENFKLEGERLNQATEFFKGNNFTQAQAQAAVDLFTKLASEDAGAMAQALDAARQQQVETWGQQAKDALGDKYDETVGLARTAVQHVNDPELTEAFNELGWGNHPALIRAFAKFGESMRDSKVEGLGGATANGGEKSPGERMYAHATDMRRNRG